MCGCSGTSMLVSLMSSKSSFSKMGILKLFLIWFVYVSAISTIIIIVQIFDIVWSIMNLILNISWRPLSFVLELQFLCWFQIWKFFLSIVEIILLLILRLSPLLIGFLSWNGFWFELFFSNGLNRYKLSIHQLLCWIMDIRWSVTIFQKTNVRILSNSILAFSNIRFTVWTVLSASPFPCGL